MFGCFNNFTKVTDDVLKVWAEILRQVPDSHLLLKAAEAATELLKDDPRLEKEENRRLKEQTARLLGKAEAI